MKRIFIAVFLIFLSIFVGCYSLNKTETICNKMITEINKATEKLMTSFYDISTKLYQQAGAQAQAEPQAEAQNATASDDNVVDADYQVVDDEENK